jgi:hypothetical protein
MGSGGRTWLTISVVAGARGPTVLVSVRGSVGDAPSPEKKLAPGPRLLKIRISAAIPAMIHPILMCNTLFQSEGP